MKENKNIKKVETQLEYLTGDEELQRLIELKEKEEYDKADALAFAERKGINKGIKKGMAKGMAKGKIVGIAEGKIAGIAEGKIAGIAEGKIAGIAEGEAKSKKETALALKKLGVAIEIISKSTGLTIEEIQNLK